MRKCATAVGGLCDIAFQPTKTVLSFTCPATAFASTAQKPSAEFKVPVGTWGIGIDDSKIQRRLMSRIFQHAGVDKERMIIFGESASDVKELQATIESVLQKDESCKILMLVDENLDYLGSSHESISGSEHMAGVLKSMEQEKASRLLALMRSANDNEDDVAMFKSRAHGYFPKVAVKKKSVLEILSPVWCSRFTSETPGDAEDMSERSMDPLDLITKEDLHLSLSGVEDVIDAESGAPWTRIRSALNTLQGDLSMMEYSDDATSAVRMIQIMRGRARPANFDEKWGQVREVITDLLDSMKVVSSASSC